MKANPSFGMVIFLTAIATPLLFQFTSIYSIKHTLIHLCAFHTLCFTPVFPFYICKQMCQWIGEYLRVLTVVSYWEGIARSAPWEARPEKYICEQDPGGQKCSSLICWLEMPVSPSSQARSTSQSSFSFTFFPPSLFFEPTRVFKHTELPTDHIHLEAWKQKAALKCVLISGDLINLLIAANALTAWACHFILLSTFTLLHLVAPKKWAVHPHFLLIKTTQKICLV